MSGVARKVACFAFGALAAAFFAISAVGSAAGSASCNTAREAILTGDPAAESTVWAVASLATDVSAPPAARDYAHVWLTRDTAGGRASAGNGILKACR